VQCVCVCGGGGAEECFKSLLYCTSKDYHPIYRDGHSLQQLHGTVSYSSVYLHELLSCLHYTTPQKCTIVDILGEPLEETAVKSCIVLQITECTDCGHTAALTNTVSLTFPCINGDFQLPEAPWGLPTRNLVPGIWCTRC
jgi:hypothetical protein